MKILWDLYNFYNMKIFSSCQTQPRCRVLSNKNNFVFKSRDLNSSKGKHALFQSNDTSF